MKTFLGHLPGLLDQGHMAHCYRPKGEASTSDLGKQLLLQVQGSIEALQVSLNVPVALVHTGNGQPAAKEGVGVAGVRKVGVTG